MKLICDCGAVILEGDIPAGAAFIQIEVPEDAEGVAMACDACGRLALAVRPASGPPTNEEPPEPRGPELKAV